VGVTVVLAVLTALLVALVPGALLAGAASANPAPPADGQRPLWVMPDSGDPLAAFDRNDYNEQDGTPRAVPSPSGSGQQALEFSLDGGGERSEVQPRIPMQREGDVQYYSYSAVLADDFPTDVTTWQLLLQWHHYGDSGSPPVAVEVRDNRLMLSAEGEDRQDLGPVRGGDRIDLTMRIAFSRDSDRGTVDVWRDGDRVLRSYKPPGGTLLDQSDYMKLGLYRDESIDEPARLVLEDLRIGPSLASVRSQESGSSAIAEDDAPSSTSGGSDDGALSTASWVAGGLLVLVVILAGAALRSRRVHR
jgi:hypothetical protein